MDHERGRAVRARPLSVSEPLPVLWSGKELDAPPAGILALMEYVNKLEAADTQALKQSEVVIHKQVVPRVPHPAVRQVEDYASNVAALRAGPKAGAGLLPSSHYIRYNTYVQDERNLPSEYDADEEDEQWLEQHTSHKVGATRPPLSLDDLEKLVELFEMLDLQTFQEALKADPSAFSKAGQQPASTSALSWYEASRSVHAVDLRHARAVFDYWKQKRESSQGPLLQKLWFEMPWKVVAFPSSHPNPSRSSTRPPSPVIPFSASTSAADNHRALLQRLTHGEALSFMQEVREDLEELRTMVDQVRKREKIKRRLALLWSELQYRQCGTTREDYLTEQEQRLVAAVQAEQGLQLPVTEGNANNDNAVTGSRDAGEVGEGSGNGFADVKWVENCGAAGAGGQVAGERGRKQPDGNAAAASTAAASAVAATATALPADTAGATISAAVAAANGIVPTDAAAQASGNVPPVAAADDNANGTAGANNSGAGIGAAALATAPATAANDIASNAKGKAGATNGGASIGTTAAAIAGGGEYDGTAAALAAEIKHGTRKRKQDDVHLESGMGTRSKQARLDHPVEPPRSRPAANRDLAKKHGMEGPTSPVPVTATSAEQKSPVAMTATGAEQKYKQPEAHVTTRSRQSCLDLPVKLPSNKIRIRKDTTEMLTTLAPRAGTDAEQLEKLPKANVTSRSKQVHLDHPVEPQCSRPASKENRAQQHEVGRSINPDTAPGADPKQQEQQLKSSVTTRSKQVHLAHPDEPHRRRPASKGNCSKEHEVEGPTNPDTATNTKQLDTSVTTRNNRALQQLDSLPQPPPSRTAAAMLHSNTKYGKGVHSGITTCSEPTSQGVFEALLHSSAQPAARGSSHGHKDSVKQHKSGITTRSKQPPHVVVEEPPPGLANPLNSSTATGSPHGHKSSVEQWKSGITTRSKQASQDVTEASPSSLAQPLNTSTAMGNPHDHKDSYKQRKAGITTRSKQVAQDVTQEPPPSLAQSLRTSTAIGSAHDHKDSAEQLLQKSGVTTRSKPVPQDITQEPPPSSAQFHTASAAVSRLHLCKNHATQPKSRITARSKHALPNVAFNASPSLAPPPPAAAVNQQTASAGAANTHDHKDILDTDAIDDDSAAGTRSKQARHSIQQTSPQVRIHAPGTHRKRGTANKPARISPAPVYKSSLTQPHSAPSPASIQTSQRRVKPAYLNQAAQLEASHLTNQQTQDLSQPASSMHSPSPGKPALRNDAAAVDTRVEQPPAMVLRSGRPALTPLSSPKALAQSSDGIPYSAKPGTMKQTPHHTSAAGHNKPADAIDPTVTAQAAAGHVVTFADPLDPIVTAHAAIALNNTSADLEGPASVATRTPSRRAAAANNNTGVGTIGQSTVTKPNRVLQSLSKDNEAALTDVPHRPQADGVILRSGRTFISPSPSPKPAIPPFIAPLSSPRSASVSFPDPIPTKTHPAAKANPAKPASFIAPLPSRRSAPIPFSEPVPTKPNPGTRASSAIRANPAKAAQRTNSQAPPMETALEASPVVLGAADPSAGCAADPPAVVLCSGKFVVKPAANPTPTRRKRNLAASRAADVVTSPDEDQQPHAHGRPHSPCLPGNNAQFDGAAQADINATSYLPYDTTHVEPIGDSALVGISPARLNHLPRIGKPWRESQAAVNRSLSRKGKGVQAHSSQDLLGDGEATGGEIYDALHEVCDGHGLEECAEFCDGNRLEECEEVSDGHGLEDCEELFFIAPCVQECNARGRQHRKKRKARGGRNLDMQGEGSGEGVLHGMQELDGDSQPSGSRQAFDRIREQLLNAVSHVSGGKKRSRLELLHTGAGRGTPEPAER